ncbi:hypothetical protein [Phenylobacterium sp.]|uniref:hypothetical protein n=1 Tax=Phenylobacterium sp. TaxID=1871053 RepID=UPI0030F40210
MTKKAGLLLGVAGLLVYSANCFAADKNTVPLDAGARPTQTEAVRTGEQAIRQQMFDPDAAKIEWPYLFKSGTLKPTFGKPTAGFWTCGLINGKNRYGAYSGQTWFLIMINNGVVNALDVGTPGEIGMATASCPDFLEKGVLQPVPAVN